MPVFNNLKNILAELDKAGVGPVFALSPASVLSARNRADTTRADSGNRTGGKQPQTL
jgi:hypothetical protein